MNILGRLLWWYIDTLFGAICRGTDTLWQARMRRIRSVQSGGVPGG